MSETLKQYPLHTEMRVLPGRLIAVGNTGMRVSVEAGKWVHHFTPDGQRFRLFPWEWGKRVKYASILALAHRTFAEWWRDRGTFEWGGYPLNDIVHFLNSPEQITKNLRSLYPQSIFYADSDYDYQWNVATMVDQLSTLTKLHQIAERCERQKYQMNSRIQL